MSYQYRKSGRKNVRKTIRIFGFVVFILGIIIAGYIMLPFISWSVYFAPVFASQYIEAPIPKTTIINPVTIKSLLSQAANAVSGVDYSNAHNWFPAYKESVDGKPRVSEYTLSIPKLKIQNANVTTVDYNLGEHLVHYGGTALPPDNGTAVVFGHSTLPQLFNPSDYKTIFANAYTLKVGDDFSVTISGIVYNYKIYSITVVDAEDTSVFAQKYDSSYITLVTCTPPGTVWKRLLVQARLEKL